MVLRRIGVLSAGKVVALMYVVLGLILGAFITLISTLGGLAAVEARGGDAALFIGFGAGAIIIIPILYGIGGFIFGIIMAALYNIVAAMAGGLELELGPASDPYAPPSEEHAWQPQR